MIRYAILCDSEHGFDAWFRSSGDFDAQAEAGLVTCPVCGSADVRKALMAPALAEAAAEPTARTEPTREFSIGSEKDVRLRELLGEIRRHVTANSEDVGERFPDLARKMHAEEIERRSIRGRASADEARALVEEGVEIHPLPSFPDDGH